MWFCQSFLHIYSFQNISEAIPWIGVKVLLVAFICKITQIGCKYPNKKGQKTKETRIDMHMHTIVSLIYFLFLTQIKLNWICVYYRNCQCWIYMYKSMMKYVKISVRKDLNPWMVKWICATKHTKPSTNSSTLSLSFDFILSVHGFEMAI